MTDDMVMINAPETVSVFNLTEVEAQTIPIIRKIASEFNLFYGIYYHAVGLDIVRIRISAWRPAIASEKKNHIVLERLSERCGGVREVVEFNVTKYEIWLEKDILNDENFIDDLKGIVVEALL